MSSKYLVVEAEWLKAHADHEYQVKAAYEARGDTNNVCFSNGVIEAYSLVHTHARPLTAAEMRVGEMMNVLNHIHHEMLWYNWIDAHDVWEKVRKILTDIQKAKEEQNEPSPKGADDE